MSRQYMALVSLSVCLVFAGLAHAGKAVAPEDMPDLIQKRYETLKTFRCDFVQELTNVASGDVEERRGRIWFRQPSQVRWETLEPEKELLVVGPDYAWDYIEAEQLALKYGVEALLDSKTILRFISGRANLKEDFVIKTEWQGADEVRERWGKGFTVLQLLPKEPEPGMVLAYVGVEPDTGLLRQVMIVDFYGNGNEVRLSNVKQDIKLSADMFTFVPPEGVQVEDNTQGF
ncbi:MAG: outer membrane lipoprotein carrier protein LolA [Pseudodesulfovibrio sp.]|uniref:Outer membrane lipoprotein carrier protein LolA n=1 Tax=Pseudodesulfovibrio aespoeensis (strain ATCC 700646 / DSM 10631 / Aspo-2) TaxID=643562 RepID=E6VX75_PSEA9|nr:MULTISPECIES: outer membrane lipoprotein carrier protein LolA [Pseudodesulfovibrio]MBU4377896.1 outer membrane lipoprotein carrier protein LolA [Pseudomonadota bacterium]ADU62581.1 outer membrane lipoprotein carrier protein LolA [Pseudodesulfovibrio aespoeensis Aspo-2]MBU4476185.1 outer membrane lipoprotein carrier protein LolA [Pseudomonadota bacterium]MBU4516520.1 outer membrane lipoprotein carrier protein LolA [Pseudomonadota bacterium]MBU4521541.1 outer membrane lipoprotein carrier prot